MSVKPSDFTRQPNDVNGNPRYAVHFLELLTDEERSNYGYGWSLDRKYEIALKRARLIGGKKYHNKRYGGGIVFQEYDDTLGYLCDAINLALSKDNAKQIEEKAA